eukprot:gene9149-16274_t
MLRGSGPPPKPKKRFPKLFGVLDLLARDKAKSKGHHSSVPTEDKSRFLDAAPSRVSGGAWSFTPKSLMHLEGNTGTKGTSIPRYGHSRTHSLRRDSPLVSRSGSGFGAQDGSPSPPAKLGTAGGDKRTSQLGPEAAVANNGVEVVHGSEAVIADELFSPEGILLTADDSLRRRTLAPEPTHGAESALDKVPRPNEAPPRSQQPKEEPAEGGSDPTQGSCQEAAPGNDPTQVSFQEAATGSDMSQGSFQEAGAAAAAAHSGPEAARAAQPAGSTVQDQGTHALGGDGRDQIPHALGEDPLQGPKLTDVGVYDVDGAGGYMLSNGENLGGFGQGGGDHHPSRVALQGGRAPPRKASVQGSDPTTLSSDGCMSLSGGGHGVMGAGVKVPGRERTHAAGPLAHSQQGPGPNEAPREEKGASTAHSNTNTEAAGLNRQCDGDAAVPEAQRRQGQSNSHHARPHPEHKAGSGVDKHTGSEMNAQPPHQGESEEAQAPPQPNSKISGGNAPHVQQIESEEAQAPPQLNPNISGGNAPPIGLPGGGLPGGGLPGGGPPGGGAASRGIPIRRRSSTSGFSGMGVLMGRHKHAHFAQVAEESEEFEEVSLHDLGELVSSHDDASELHAKAANAKWWTRDGQKSVFWNESDGTDDPRVQNSMDPGKLEAVLEAYTEFEPPLVVPDVRAPPPSRQSSARGGGSAQQGRAGGAGRVGGAGDGRAVEAEEEEGIFSDVRRAVASASGMDTHATAAAIYSAIYSATHSATSCAVASASGMRPNGMGAHGMVADDIDTHATATAADSATSSATSSATATTGMHADGSGVCGVAGVQGVTPSSYQAALMKRMYPTGFPSISLLIASEAGTGGSQVSEPGDSAASVGLESESRSATCSACGSEDRWEEEIPTDVSIAGAGASVGTDAEVLDPQEAATKEKFDWMVEVLAEKRSAGTLPTAGQAGHGQGSSNSDGPTPPAAASGELSAGGAVLMQGGTTSGELSARGAAPMQGDTDFDLLYDLSRLSLARPSSPVDYRGPQYTNVAFPRGTMTTEEWGQASKIISARVDKSQGRKMSSRARSTLVAPCAPHPHANEALKGELFRGDNSHI